jgi:hypothetical protein
MKHSRFSEEQIIAILKEQEAGVPVGLLRGLVDNFVSMFQEASRDPSHSCPDGPLSAPIAAVRDPKELD